MAALLVAGAIAGAWLGYQQGWRALGRFEEELASGGLPTDALLDGAIIVTAAILLIMPGMITDVLGLLLLLPPTRTVFKRWLIARLEKFIQVPLFNEPAAQPLASDDAARS